jgi:hypothetical protein
MMAFRMPRKSCRHVGSSMDTDALDDCSQSNCRMALNELAELSQGELDQKGLGEFFTRLQVYRQHRRTFSQKHDTAAAAMPTESEVYLGVPPLTADDTTKQAESRLTSDFGAAAQSAMVDEFARYPPEVFTKQSDQLGMTGQGGVSFEDYIKGATDQRGIALDVYSKRGHEDRQRSFSEVAGHDGGSGIAGAIGIGSWATDALLGKAMAQKMSLEFEQTEEEGQGQQDAETWQRVEAERTQAAAARRPATDTGYSSMSRSMVAGPTSQMYDGDSVHSDGEHFIMEESMKDAFVSEFSKELSSGIDKAVLDEEDFDRLLDIVAESLKDYSIELKGQAKPGLQRNAVVFVRRYRRYEQSFL